MNKVEESTDVLNELDFSIVCYSTKFGECKELAQFLWIKDLCNHDKYFCYKHAEGVRKDLILWGGLRCSVCNITVTEDQCKLLPI